MNTAVVTFPGSNCDRDMRVAIAQVFGKEPAQVWHRETALPERLDFIALPGGFSYGDYLRAGAMAANSPIMREIAREAARGVPVLGVCNGFQVLCEARLLPGALLRNAGQRFVCRDARLRVENADTRFTSDYAAGEIITIPVAHHDGNFFADEATLDTLEREGRVVFRYTRATNGSARDIAGIVSESGTVLGMMPHPERAIDAAHGGTDGRRLFASLARSLAETA